MPEIQMARTIDDPVLGVMRFDYLWEGQITLPHLGEMNLSVSTLGGRDPEEWQKSAFRQLVDAINEKLVEEIRALIADYAASQKRNGLLEDSSCEIPESSHDVLLDDARMFIPPVKGAAFDLVLDCEVDWALEHGIQVMFYEGKPVRASQIGDDDVDP
ncbi:MAG: hypothetical protein AAF561_08730 [Planctomycetota bacterium]